MVVAGAAVEGAGEAEEVVAEEVVAEEPRPWAYLSLWA